MSWVGHVRAVIFKERALMLHHLAGATIQVANLPGKLGFIFLSLQIFGGQN